MFNCPSQRPCAEFRVVALVNEKFLGLFGQFHPEAVLGQSFEYFRKLVIDNDLQVFSGQGFEDYRVIDAV